MILHTHTGRNLDPWELQPEDVCIEDIAHALSMTCRFGGHVKHHYSVAQHSMLVEAIVALADVPAHVRMAALLHDAAEAYLVDIPTPVKVHLPGYKLAEDRAMRAIFRRFGVPTTLLGSELVKIGDMRAFATEVRDIFAEPDLPEGYMDRFVGHEPLPHAILQMTQPVVERAFLLRFRMLRGLMPQLRSAAEPAP